MRTMTARELLVVTRPDFYALRVGETISVPTSYGEATGPVEGWRVDEREEPVWRNGYELSGYRARVVACEFRVGGHGWLSVPPEALIKVHAASGEATHE